MINLKSLLNRVYKGVNQQEEHDVNDLLSSSQKNIKRSLSFLNQLHTVIKLDKKQKSNKQEFLLEELVDEAVLQYAEQQRIKIMPYESTLKIKIFEDSIYLILSNLISNALKYSPPSSPVYIDISSENKDLIIQCHSQGTPITNSIKEALNYPNAGFHLASHPAVKGLGFGLHIIMLVVQQYDGNITLSHPSSRGNKFYIQLKNVIA